MIREKSHPPAPEWNAKLLTVEVIITYFAAVNLIELKRINTLKTKHQ